MPNDLTDAPIAFDSSSRSKSSCYQTRMARGTTCSWSMNFERFYVTQTYSGDLGGDYHLGRSPPCDAPRIWIAEMFE